VSCAAVGLLIATIFRMMTPLVKRLDLVGLAILAAVLVAVGVLRLPLPAVLLVGIPLSLVITVLARRWAAA
jgi:chromate transporter